MHISYKTSQDDATRPAERTLEPRFLDLRIFLHQQIAVPHFRVILLVVCESQQSHHHRSLM